MKAGMIDVERFDQKKKQVIKKQRIFENIFFLEIFHFEVLRHVQVRNTCLIMHWQISFVSIAVSILMDFWNVF